MGAERSRCQQGDSDGLVDEAGGAGTDAPVSLPRGQESEEIVCRVAGIYGI